MDGVGDPDENRGGTIVREGKKGMDARRRIEKTTRHPNSSRAGPEGSIPLIFKELLTMSLLGFQQASVLELTTMLKLLGMTAEPSRIALSRS